MKTRTVWQSVSLTLVAVAVGFAATSWFVQRPSARPTHVLSGVKTNTNWGAVELSHPLIAGEEIGVDQAVASLAECAVCPKLESDAAAVKEAYVDEGGGVGFILADGSWFVGVPDPRSSKEYIADFESLISSEEGSPFHIQQLADGTDVVTAEASESGSAVVMWVEGGRLWEVVGKGGAPLSELVSFTDKL